MTEVPGPTGPCFDLGGGGVSTTESKIIKGCRTCSFGLIVNAKKNRITGVYLRFQLQRLTIRPPGPNNCLANPLACIDTGLTFTFDGMFILCANLGCANPNKNRIFFHLSNEEIKVKTIGSTALEIHSRCLRLNNLSLILDLVNSCTFLIVRL